LSSDEKSRRLYNEEALDDDIHLAPAVESTKMHRCWVTTSGRFVGNATSKFSRSSNERE
jgi:hypothetical protein